MRPARRRHERMFPFGRDAVNSESLGEAARVPPARSSPTTRPHSVPRQGGIDAAAALSLRVPRAEPARLRRDPPSESHVGSVARFWRSRSVAGRCGDRTQTGLGLDGHTAAFLVSRRRLPRAPGAPQGASHHDGGAQGDDRRRTGERPSSYRRPPRRAAAPGRRCVRHHTPVRQAQPGGQVREHRPRRLLGQPEAVRLRGEDPLPLTRSRRDTQTSAALAAQARSRASVVGSRNQP